jgi:hypothetical protein
LASCKKIAVHTVDFVESQEGDGIGIVNCLVGSAPWAVFSHILILNARNVPVGSELSARIGSSEAIGRGCGWNALGGGVLTQD